jgi:hypothetical protein
MVGVTKISHSRLIYPATLLVAVALAAPCLAGPVFQRDPWPTVEVKNKDVRVDRRFTFRLRVGCVLPKQLLPGTRRICRGHARIVTNKWGLFGPMPLSGGPRTYRLAHGKERVLSFHLLRRAHAFLEKHRQLWVWAEFGVAGGGDAHRAVLLHWTPSRE